MNYIHAAAYGLSIADTGAANATAMTQAIAVAVSTGKPLLVPAGAFNIDCYDTQNTGAVAINGSVAIFGAGQDRTIFKMVNYDQARGGAMFHIAPGRGTAVCFNDLTLQGPSTALLTLDSAVCWAVWCGGGGSLRMTRVHAYGFIQEVKCSPEYPTYPGRGTKATYEDCFFESRGVAILHIEGTDPLADSCDLVGTIFQPMQGVPVIPPVNTNGQWPNIYINRGVSLGVRGCKFLGANGNGWGYLHYGGSATPRYAYCADSYFDGSMVAGGSQCSAMLTGSTAKTLVTGCTFAMGSGQYGIRPQGDAHFSNCAWLGGTGSVYGVLDDQIADTEIGFSNCYFGAAKGNGWLYGASRTTHDPSVFPPGTVNGNGWLYGAARTTGFKPWRFVNCTFGDMADGGAGVLVNAGTVLFEDCNFAGTTGVYSVRVQGGTAVLNRCLMSGTKPNYIDTTVAPATLEYWGVRWGSSATAPTEINTPSAALTIRGADNQMAESSGQAIGFVLLNSTNIANLTGNLECRRGVGGYTYTNADRVLRLNWNYDTYEINEGGGPTIDTINMLGYEIGGAVPTDQNRFCGATVKLRVVQAFTLGNAGNIVAASGQRAVGAVVTLQYFPSAAKWHEV